MTSLRTVLAGAVALLLAAPPASAQQLLQTRGSAQKPAFTFSKDVTSAAPAPRLDLSPMMEAAGQDPDPTGMIALAQDAAGSGASSWIWGGLLFAGLGGAILYQQMEAEEQDDDLVTIGGTMLGGGVVAMLVGTILNADRGPQPYVGKTRGGVAAGVRIPLGRR